MSVNKYFPFAIIYFFLNSLGLPFGLTYTALLSPLFYWWIISVRKRDILMPFLGILVPFAFIHINFVGVDIKSYLISLANLTAVYIFCQAFWTFLVVCIDHEKIFMRLLVINFVLCLVAMPLYSSPYYDIFWIQQFLTEGIDNFRRLKLFTYEASFYATIFTPLFFFYFLQTVLKQNKINAWLLLMLILLPYILSFSIGVISACLISIAITFIVNFKRLLKKRRVLNIIAMLIMLAIPAITALFIFFPENALFSRIGNIFSGQDPSGKGRTFEAFILANKLLDQKSHLFGIGLGQIKILGEGIIRDYYLYPMDYNVIGIPNAAAETLAIFGWVGLFIRIGLEIILFFYTRVWTNYYRMLLFIFMFLYQFTGSFITNTGEYVIWILAFTNTFAAFDISQTYNKRYSFIVESLRRGQT